MTDQELRDLIAENSKGIKELRESHREFQKNIEIDFKKSREEFDK
jgi:hypothetical protein